MNVDAFCIGLLISSAQPLPNHPPSQPLGFCPGARVSEGSSSTAGVVSLVVLIEAELFWTTFVFVFGFSSVLAIFGLRPANTCNSSIGKSM